MSKEVAEWLVAQWTSRFSEIMLTMGDVQPQMHVAHGDQAATPDDLLWWEQPFDCQPEAPVWTGAPQEAWTEIGKVVLAAAGVDPAPASEIQSTYLEIVRQSMGSLGQDIGQRLSVPVSCLKGEETGPAKSGAHWFKVQVEIPTLTVDIYLVITPELCDLLASSHETESESESSALVHAAKGEPEPVAEALPISRTFELLLDVEMPVSVSFGRASLKLYDAINLMTGSLIELDRFVTDPVELLVNNCVIARGEVVVVEGNYGVRITEIVSQKERLQQSRRYMLH